ncbi:methyl-accepting chemotaxis protein [Treponema ruminis]|uniref:Putative Holliday junction resolvase-like endonuclease n=1 Tax=Treponema ruminis TaxID=744515 RepID=A0A7W8G9D4_9SPIR|nr:methyl-accepting chemotaxis protein [Treponema ruminis]MBB5226267.1 putative Holliday junction resolvase-like endonuclease [Treponema ruminis]QSI02826.1 methyl-accepting chemotaxis protein [Treponema ruminis]
MEINKNSYLSKTFSISVAVILLVAILLGIVYKMISNQTAIRNLNQKLREEVSQKAILMEGYLKPEIALVEKLSTSPAIVQFFKDPSDKDNRRRAMAEFQSFSDSFSSHMIFWANDIDKEFWNGMKFSYNLDPENPSDYWYKMTLYETDVYNFNINYNAEIGMTCLWLNVVVRDEKGKPIGMAGTGIELDNFIKNCFDMLGEGFTMYFFNGNKEVTGAMDKKTLVDKVHIDELYNQIPDFNSLIETAKRTAGESGSIGLYNIKVSSQELGVIRYLPSYGWYLFITAPVKSGKQGGISAFLVVIIAIQLVFSIFVIFIAKLHGMMQKTRLASQSLVAETQNLSVSSKENAATAQDQSTAVKEIVATMEDNTALSEDISQKIKNVSDVASKTNSDVAEGVNYIEENVRQLQEIAATNLNTINGIKALGDKIENIWDIVTLINAVADQAKIIAFNAELEASSAGEAGRNFHIVATEIRRLADGIIDGTKEIKERITEIQQSSDSLIIASETGTEKIQEGVDSAKSLEERFTSIKNASEVTANSASDITTIIQQQAIASEQMLTTLKQIAAGVENFTVATEHISKASQNVKTIATELSNSKNSVARAELEE